MTKRPYLVEAVEPQRGNVWILVLHQGVNDGQTSVAVTMRLLEAIAVIPPFTNTKVDRAALLRHANMIERGSHEGIPEELDRKDVKERYLAAVKAIA